MLYAEAFAFIYLAATQQQYRLDVDQQKQFQLPNLYYSILFWNAN